MKPLRERFLEALGYILLPSERALFIANKKDVLSLATSINLLKLAMTAVAAKEKETKIDTSEYN